MTVLSCEVINEYPDWTKWPGEADVLFKAMYGRFPDMETESVDWTLAKREAQEAGIIMSPMVEVDPQSWRNCLGVFLDVIEERVARSKIQSSLPPTQVWACYFYFYFY